MTVVLELGKEGCHHWHYYHDSVAREATNMSCASCLSSLSVLQAGSEANLYYCLQDDEWQVKASLEHRYYFYSSVSGGGGVIVIFVYVCNDDVDRCSLLLDVARGLQHMHRHHVLHRDIKSHNILLMPSSLLNAEEAVDGRRSMLSIAAVGAAGAGFTAKITDFGSSLLLSSADACVLNDPVGKEAADCIESLSSCFCSDLMCFNSISFHFIRLCRHNGLHCPRSVLNRRI